MTEPFVSPAPNREPPYDDQTILEFWAARLTETEQVARAAAPGPWHTPGPDTVGQWNIYDAHWTVAGATAYDHDEPLSNQPGARGPGYIDPDANAEHIALHDPARALREVERDRQIMAEHAPFTRTVTDDGGLAPYELTTCQACLSEDPPCRTVRLHVAVRSDHPAYRQEWRP